MASLDFGGTGRGGYLALTLKTEEGQVPLGGVRVVVYDPRGSTATNSAPQRWTQTTHTDGRASFNLPAERALRLSVRGSEQGRENATVDLDAFAPGERRNITLDVGQPPERSLRGQIVDGVHGKPVPGVELRLFSQKGGRSPLQRLDRSARPGAWSNAEGHFQLQWPAGQVAYVQMHAIGYGPLFLGVEELAVLGQSRTPIELVPSALFEVQVSGRTEPGDLVLRIQSSGQATDPDRAHPLWAGPLEWVAKNGQSSRARVLGLPSRTPLIISVTREDVEVFRSESPIELDPSEHHILNLSGDQDRRVSGVLRDGNGKPVSGVEVWLVRAETRSPKVFRLGETRPAATSKTDAGGRYTFHEPKVGDWWVGPAPGIFTDASAVAHPPVSRWVHLPSDLDHLELDLTLQAGASMRGIVHNASGEPVPHATLHYRATLAKTHLTTQCDAQGQFDAGPILPGLYELWVPADSGAGHGGSVARTVFVQPSAPAPIELTVHKGAWLQVQALAPLGGPPPRLTRALITRLEPAPLLERDLRAPSILSSNDPTPGSTASLPALTEGRVELSELQPGPYAVALYSADGQVGIVKHLAPSIHQGPARGHAPMQPVAWLLLEHLGNAHGAHYQVLLGDVIVGSGSLSCGALAEIPAPPGQLFVEWAIEGQPVRSQRVEVVAHGRARVNL